LFWNVGGQHWLPGLTTALTAMEQF